MTEEKRIEGIVDEFIKRTSDFEINNITAAVTLLIENLESTSETIEALSDLIKKEDNIKKKAVLELLVDALSEMNIEGGNEK